MPPPPPPGCDVFFTNGPPPDGTQGTDYSFQFTASGGTGPYTFSLFGLPVWSLTLDPSGLLSGPTTMMLGTYGVIVIATDSAGCWFTETFTVTIKAPCADWSQLLWGASSIQTDFGHVTNNGTGSFTPNNAASASFHGHCDSPDAFFGTDEVLVTNTATLSYNGPACNCKLNAALTEFSTNNELVELFSNVEVKQGATTLIAFSNPGVNLFTLLDTGGVPQVITITVTLHCPHGWPLLVDDHEWIDLVGTFSNVP